MIPWKPEHTPSLQTSGRSTKTHTLTLTLTHTRKPKESEYDIKYSNQRTATKNDNSKLTITIMQNTPGHTGISMKPELNHSKQIRPNIDHLGKKKINKTLEI